MIPLKSQAIQTALVGDWNNAVTLNKQILETRPDDIDALNRLAFAYLSVGQPKKAKSLYEKVLTLDMKNPIAIRNLKKLSNVKNSKMSVPLNNLFIEEPGKTKVIELLNIADKKIISRLRFGEMLELKIKRSKIFALDSENQYIGMLPDDICQRLIKFINAGNEYDAYVRTIDGNKIYILAREIKRVKKFKDEPSFVSTEKTKLDLKKTKNKDHENGEDEESAE